MKRILVVDDEPDALKMVSLTLTPEGYQVITASDGEEALRLAASERPDLILLDVMMPNMDGFEVARRLRRTPDFAQVPILFLSARGQVADKVEGLTVGGNDYLTKPAAPQELVARVGVLLGTFTERKMGHVIALFGSKAGIGTSTISVNLALALQSRSSDMVVLVDGHDEGGDIGVFLNMPHTHHAGELAARIDLLDQDVFQNALLRHASGLRVLLAPPETSLASSISPSAWEHIVEELRRISGVVVFDGPPLHSATWAPMLGLADEVFLITTPEITAMRRLTAAQELARSRVRIPDNVRVILNRYNEGSGFSVAAISRALGVSIHVTIEDVGPINTFAVNHGQPLFLSDKRNPLTRTISNLAREIVQRKSRAGSEGKR